MMNNEKKITVFTPTYNRAHTLPGTYASLCAQDRKDFIWLIIDDGSTDGTAELVSEWKTRDNGFEIRYYFKENGGMHTAHNLAYELIDTELNVCVDSDDMLAPGAIAKILDKWEQVNEQGYAGIIALDADLNGNVIGRGFPAGMRDTTVIGYYAGGGRGDKKLIYRTDIIRAFPEYPVFAGEKYFSLAYKYRLIDQQYRMAVLDEIVCHVEYQPDGSTNTMWRSYLRDPRGWAFWRTVCMRYPSSTGRLITATVHYCSSSILCGNRRFLAESPRKLLTLLLVPAGLGLSLLVRIKGSRVPA